MVSFGSPSVRPHSVSFGNKTAGNIREVVSTVVQHTNPGVPEAIFKQMVAMGHSAFEHGVKDAPVLNSKAVATAAEIAKKVVT
jgi:predicted phage gp36 major capsid-like protein